MSEKKYRHLGQEKTIPEWVKEFPFMWGQDFADKRFGFEEVVEPVEQVQGKKIEVLIEYAHVIDEDGYRVYTVRIPNGEWISEPKLPAIKEAIEGVLNPPVFDVNRINNQLARLEGIKEGFNAAREYAPTPDSHVGTPPLFYKDVNDYLKHKNSSDLSTKQSPSNTSGDEKKDWTIECFQKEGRNYWRQTKSGRYTNMPFDTGVTKEFCLEQKWKIWNVSVPSSGLDWYVGENFKMDGIGYKIIGFEISPRNGNLLALYENGGVGIKKIKKPTPAKEDEKRDWEIFQYRIGKRIHWNIGGGYYESMGHSYRFHESELSGNGRLLADIFSVKRISDGEIFSLGNEIGWGEVGNYKTTIDSFSIKDGRLQVHCPPHTDHPVDFMEAVRLHHKKLSTPSQDEKKEPLLKTYEDRKGCMVCGGELATIRGRYPNTDKREVCPTCTTERLETINEISGRDYGKTYQDKQQ